MNQNNISLENVIKGLECCRAARCDECNQPDKSGYPWDCDAFSRMIDEAIVLLKAQEPRLITEADFENADENGFIPVWCEVMSNTSDPFVIKDYWNCIPIDALETAKEDGCRYWTSKPSLKQMEETPWE